MKGVFVILDGVADEPCSSLHGKTPLESAKTPNLDWFAERGEIHKCYTVGKVIAPESSSAVVSLLGYDYRKSPRGILEARGINAKLGKNTLSFRANFCSVDNLNGKIIDRRVGRNLLTSEARELSKSLNLKLGNKYSSKFYSTIQHRGVLIFKGYFSSNISNVDPAYHEGKVCSSDENFVFSKSLDKTQKSFKTSELVNFYIRDCFDILNSHPINVSRKKRGLLPANAILLRGAGVGDVKYNKIKGKWLGIAYMPLEIGISKAVGMDVSYFTYPPFVGKSVYDNLYDGLRKGIKFSLSELRKNIKKYDYFYIHFKEFDVFGHDGNAIEKKKMVELIDREFFSHLRKIIRNGKLLVTADHVTSSEKREHTAGAVPLLVYPSHREKRKKYCERNMVGESVLGRDVLKRFLF